MQPNCYSRVISVLGNEHIIIFAKRDIDQWEELTYDYRSDLNTILLLAFTHCSLTNHMYALFRFVSNEQRLPCYCGFPKCRGVVNDVETEVQLAKIRVTRSELFPQKD